MAMGSHLSVITLNVNGLNAPTKRQRLAEWIQKQDPYICCLRETHLKTGDTYRLKVKGWKKIFCLVDLSTGLSGVLTSPTIIVLVLIFPFLSVSVCLMY